MKIKFHYTFFLMAISFVLCGYFINLIIFTTIILIHEFGHMFFAWICKFKINKVTIYPYGGLLELDIKINTSIKKELLVAIGGIISQTIGYIIFILLVECGLIREYTFNLITEYYYNILFFNILPIHPLDGSKILRLILDCFLPYKVVNLLNIIISIIVSVVVIGLNVYKFNYTWIMIGGVVVDNLIKYYCQLDYYFNLFLLERYLYDYKFRKRKIVKNVRWMQKDRYHLINKNGTYETEKQFLTRKFK